MAKLNEQPEGGGDAGAALLLAACGEAGGPRGRCTALGAWRLPATAPPPLRASAGGELRERAARRRLERPRPPPHAPPDAPPGEDELRALCTPPSALCSLGERVLGIALPAS